MAYQWKVGDKAVCIRKDGWMCRYSDGSLRPSPFRCPDFHEIIPVRGTTVQGDGNVGLYLEGYSDQKARNGEGVNYGAGNFRPLIHDKPEECEEEFLTLLKKGKKNVKA